MSTVYPALIRHHTAALTVVCALRSAFLVKYLNILVVTNVTIILIVV